MVLAIYKHFPNFTTYGDFFKILYVVITTSICKKKHTATQIDENEVFTFTNVSTHTSNRVLIGAAIHLGDAGSLVHVKGNLMKFVMSLVKL